MGIYHWPQVIGQGKKHHLFILLLQGSILSCFKKSKSYLKKAQKRERCASEFLLISGRFHLLIIYLPWVLCLSVCDSVCVCVTIAERSAILLVLAIKLTQEMRRKD